MDPETELPEETENETVLDGTAQDDMAVSPEEDPLNTDALTEEGRALFEKARSFCTGEYEGDAAALQSVMGENAAASVTIAPETGAQLTEKVLEAYINVLKDGGLSYVPAETDTYMSAELNMVNADLKTIFSIETEPAAEDLLINETPETRQALYNDTLKFFETLYGENAETTEVPAEEVPVEESAEETAGETVEETEEAVY